MVSANYTLRENWHTQAGEKKRRANRDARGRGKGVVSANYTLVGEEATEQTSRGKA